MTVETISNLEDGVELHRVSFRFEDHQLEDASDTQDQAEKKDNGKSNEAENEDGVDLHRNSFLFEGEEAENNIQDKEDGSVDIESCPPDKSNKGEEEDEESLDWAIIGLRAWIAAGQLLAAILLISIVASVVHPDIDFAESFWHLLLVGLSIVLFWVFIVILPCFRLLSISINHAVVVLILLTFPFAIFMRVVLPFLETANAWKTFAMAPVMVLYVLIIAGRCELQYTKRNVRLYSAKVVLARNIAIHTILNVFVSHILIVLVPSAHPLFTANGAKLWLLGLIAGLLNSIFLIPAFGAVFPVFLVANNTTTM